MNYAVEISGLKKKFRSSGKDLFALKGINLKIESNQVYGLLGPNGAGKTTLIYIMSTLLYPTSGTVNVLGYDCMKESDEIRARAGICIGGTHFYYDLSARENLEYYARLFGLGKEKRKEVISGLIDSLDITSFKDTHFHNLSTGMKQKVAIAKSLLNEPDILFLDEPTSGLDVEVATKIRRYLLDIQKLRKMTIILTSHQLYEVEQMCKKICIINDGKIVTDDSIAEIRKGFGFPDVLHLYLDNYKGLDFLKEIDGVLDIDLTRDGLIIELSNGASTIEKVLSLLKSKKYKVHDIIVTKASLEDMFKKIITKEGP